MTHRRILSRTGPWRILVLAGGASAERQVSLDSGTAVAECLARRGHHVRLLDPAHEPLPETHAETDVILPLLHGTGGEDGVLQRELDRIQIPWLGSSAESSALTFNKSAARRALISAGIPVAPGGSLFSGCSRSEVEYLVETVGYPLVVKPAAQGSSIGVSIVQSAEGLPFALESAFVWGAEVLIERWIAGREITVPVIDSTLYPAIEILPERQWFDFQAKYCDEQTRYRPNPAGLPSDLCSTVLRACAVCGVSAISRTDLRLAPDGSFCVLEINTIPGMTSHSLVPMSIAAAGRDAAEVLEELLWQRLQRHASGAAA